MTHDQFTFYSRLFADVLLYVATGILACLAMSWLAKRPHRPVTGLFSFLLGLFELVVTVLVCLYAVLFVWLVRAIGFDGVVQWLRFGETNKEPKEEHVTLFISKLPGESDIEALNRALTVANESPDKELPRLD